MTNDKFVKIDKCKKCGYFAYVSDGIGHNAITDKTFFCTNPDHSELNIPNVHINTEFYPILGQDTLQIHIKIPHWCKLPSAKPKTEERILFASKLKIAIMEHFNHSKKDADRQYLHGLENAIEIIEKTVRD